MKRLRNYLSGLRGDVFKLLPMKESEMNGVDNHTGEYIESLIINLTGAMKTFPVLASQKQYLYMLNNMHYIHCNPVDFKQWRTIILNSTEIIDNLYVQYGGEKNDRR